MSESGPAVSIGILGAGTMGSGIAQVAATAGHPVVLCDASPDALSRARQGLERIHGRLVEKGRLDEAGARDILGRIRYEGDLSSLGECRVVVEAIVEDLEAKQQAFRSLEELGREDLVLATNTSSLSVTAMASACRDPGRVVGTHFFNPPALMALVEVVPGLTTSNETLHFARELMASWGKIPIVARDTPGFIVNRVARPYYGEAIRILEEGIADVPTIDWAMREHGGFRMGPFELMDLIGTDVSLKATETVFAALSYDPRYRPSITQKRMVEAGWLGRKSGRGYYVYGSDASAPQPTPDAELGKRILDRILAMVMNEAADAVLFGVATAPDIDVAMVKGANYPRGPLKWCDAIGPPIVLGRLQALQEEYGEDRYRPSALLRRAARDGRHLRE